MDALFCEKKTGGHGGDFSFEQVECEDLAGFPHADAKRQLEKQSRSSGSLAFKSTPIPTNFS
jgi:hypothetical protein